MVDPGGRRNVQGGRVLHGCEPADMIEGQGDEEGAGTGACGGPTGGMPRDGVSGCDRQARRERP